MRLAPLLLTALPLLAQAPYSGHGTESISPETLQKFAPGPLPPELSRKIQSIMDLRAPGLGRLSPDGKRLYFGWNVTGSAQVWRLDGPNRFPVQLTGGEDATSIAGISADGRTLFLHRDRAGEENPGLYRMDAEGGALTPIQHLPKVRTTFAFATKDGRYAYFTANDRKPDSYAVYRYDLAKGTKEALLTEPGLWSIADHRPDGRLLVRKATGSLTAEYYERALDGTLKPLLGQGEKEEYAARYGATEGELLVLTPRFGDFRRLYRHDGNTFKPLTKERPWDISDFAIDEARTRILATVNEGGYTRLEGLDARTFKPVKLPKLPPADHVVDGATTPDGRYTPLAVGTTTALPVSWIYDWKTGALTRWVVPSAPEVNTRAFVPVKLEHYTARDGTKIPMFVRRPARLPEGAPCPVVVDFHGGPEGQSQPGFSPYAQLFVDAGFIFVQPNVRGSDGYGKAWLNADNGPKRLDVITDIEDCARHIRAAWTVNGKAPKIGIMGGSYGGYATLMGMTFFGGAYDAGVSNVGISNLLTFLNNTAPYRRILRASEYGDPEKDKEALIKLSPTTYLDRLQGPLLIIQGASDPRVPVGEAVQMFEAASKKLVPSGLVIFADEGHGAQKRGNRVLQMGHTLLWMQKYLQGQ